MESFADTEQPSESLEKTTIRLVGRIKKGIAVTKACEAEVATYITVDGESLTQIAKRLKVNVPEDPDDLKGLETAQAQVCNNIQTAESILARYDSTARSLESLHNKAFAAKYVMVMESEQKLAAEKIKQKTLLDDAVDHSLAGTEVSRLITEFMKRVVNGLVETRKGIENKVRLAQLRNHHNY